MDPQIYNTPGPGEPVKLMCMVCGHTIEAGSPEHDKANEKGGCPECGAIESPARANSKPSWSMTWLELQTLTIWAERWAVYSDTHPPVGMQPTTMRRVIRGIVDRLTFQNLGGVPLLLSQMLAEESAQPGIELLSQNVDPDAPLYKADLPPEMMKAQLKSEPVAKATQITGPYNVTLIIDCLGREVGDIDLQFATESLLRLLPGTPRELLHWYTRTDLFREFMAKTSTFRGTMSHGTTIEPSFDGCLGDDPLAAVRLVNVKLPQ